MAPLYYLKFLVVLIFVLCLMGGLSYILRRFNIGQGAILSPAQKRLKIVEILHLDGRRKAMLLQRDNAEHLVILSTSGETVVETNIKAPAIKKATVNKEKNADEKTNS